MLNTVFCLCALVRKLTSTHVNATENGLRCPKLTNLNLRIGTDCGNVRLYKCFYFDQLYSKLGEILANVPISKPWLFWENDCRVSSCFAVMTDGKHWIPKINMSERNIPIQRNVLCEYVDFNKMICLTTGSSLTGIAVMKTIHLVEFSETFTKPVVQWVVGATWTPWILLPKAITVPPSIIGGNPSLSEKFKGGSFISYEEIARVPVTARHCLVLSLVETNLIYEFFYLLIGVCKANQKSFATQSQNSYWKVKNRPFRHDLQ